jgi:hypothetical protein
MPSPNQLEETPIKRAMVGLIVMIILAFVRDKSTSAPEKRGFRGFELFSGVTDTVSIVRRPSAS